MRHKSHFGALRKVFDARLLDGVVVHSLTARLGQQGPSSPRNDFVKIALDSLLDLRTGTKSRTPTTTRRATRRDARHSPTDTGSGVRPAHVPARRSLARRCARRANSPPEGRRVRRASTPTRPVSARRDDPGAALGLAGRTCHCQFHFVRRR